MPESAPLTPGERRARAAGVGCFMAFIGLFSGAMIAVLLSVVVAAVTKAPRCPDIPSCNWYIYALFGGIAGAISLPLLVLRRLGASERDAQRNL